MLDNRQKTRGFDESHGLANLGSFFLKWSLVLLVMAFFFPLCVVPTMFFLMSRFKDAATVGFMSQAIAYLQAEGFWDSLIIFTALLIVVSVFSTLELKKRYFYPSEQEARDNDSLDIEGEMKIFGLRCTDERLRSIHQENLLIINRTREACHRKALFYEALNSYFVGWIAIVSIVTPIFLNLGNPTGHSRVFIQLITLFSALCTGLYSIMRVSENYKMFRTRAFEIDHALYQLKFESFPANGKEYTPEELQEHYRRLNAIIVNLFKEEIGNIAAVVNAKSSGDSASKPTEVSFTEPPTLVKSVEAAPAAQKAPEGTEVTGPAAS